MIFNNVSWRMLINIKKINKESRIKMDAFYPSTQKQTWKVVNTENENSSSSSKSTKPIKHALHRVSYCRLRTPDNAQTNGLVVKHGWIDGKDPTKHYDMVAPFEGDQTNSLSTFTRWCILCAFLFCAMFFTYLICKRNHNKQN